MIKHFIKRPQYHPSLRKVHTFFTVNDINCSDDNYPIIKQFYNKVSDKFTKYSPLCHNPQRFHNVYIRNIIITNDNIHNVYAKWLKVNVESCNVLICNHVALDKLNLTCDEAFVPSDIKAPHIGLYLKGGIHDLRIICSQYIINDADIQIRTKGGSYVKILNPNNKRQLIKAIYL